MPCNLRLFSDEPSPCSYLPDRTARLCMSLSQAPVSPQQFDELMLLGYRRSGLFYYCTQCPQCSACEPVRLDVHQFRPSRSQRRVLNRGTQLRCELNRPTVDERRLELFNLHRLQRHLGRDDAPITASDYESFLLRSPNPSLELSLWHEQALVAVSITDVGRDCLSAVYCFFDPHFSRWSPGTLCILMQIVLARRQQMQWLYLGFYVAANRHLAYKANFRPHQRRIDGQWQDFD